MTTSIETIDAGARVWIYQSNRPFSANEQVTMRVQLQDFAEQWTSHNRDLLAGAEVFHDRFIVLMVDEGQADASGCSIDKSVAFIKYLQANYEVDLFDRMLFSYLDEEGTVHTAPRSVFAQLYAAGTIHDETRVFDTLVATKGAFDAGFIKPLGQSWHRRMV